MRYTAVDSASFAKHASACAPLLDAWAYVNGSISATFRVRSFAHAGEFAAQIAQAADDMDHHPDIDIRFPADVRVALTTHATGGVSEHDVRLAEFVSSLATRYAQEP